MEALIAKLVEWGPTPAILILAALIGWLIRKLERNSKADGERAAAFQKMLAEHIDATNDRFAEQTERMASIERDYLTRETHFKDIGGWRTDLNNLRDNISAEFRGLRQELAFKGAKNGN